MVARARQFSSFIVLVGRIGSADTFEPKYAMVMQNKDDLKIPLELEQIPTAKVSERHMFFGLGCRCPQVFINCYFLISLSFPSLSLSLSLARSLQAFREAIESMSPEQQRFAKAIRGMQLESTLFAVCLIQIKPALEKLLKLPDDSLTKEIRLTQDLLDLFMTYNIPSDMVSARFGGWINLNIIIFFLNFFLIFLILFILFYFFSLLFSFLQNA